MPHEVFFKVRCNDTRLGYHVRVVGDCESLGSWNPQAAVPLQTSSAEFPLWGTPEPLTFPDDAAIEYKYVICDNDGQAEFWETDRPNRCLHFPSLVQRGVLPAPSPARRPSELRAAAAIGVRLQKVITVCEDFNEANEEDDDGRFQAEHAPAGLPSPGLQRRLNSTASSLNSLERGRRPSLNRHGNASSDLTGAALGQASASFAGGLFVPTARERLQSSSSLLPQLGPSLSSPELEHPAARQSPQSSFGFGPAPPVASVGGLRSPAGSMDEAAIIPEVTPLGSPASRQVSGNHLAAGGSTNMLVREESCSNLFGDLNEEGNDVEVPGLPRFEDRYALVGQGPLGEGTFGLVWRCVPKLKSQQVREAPEVVATKQGSAFARYGEERAAKIVRKAHLQQRDMRHLLGDDGEVQTHLTMTHPHIVNLFEFFDERNTVTLVLEYCRGGDLFDAIVRQAKVTGRGLPESAAVVAMRHVLSALQYLHGNKVVHRDLKCENVLLALAGGPLQNNTYKLCDFGFAAVDLGGGLCDRLGSPDTVAPEVVVGSKYSFPADVWSAGVLLYMIVTAVPPFSAPTDAEVLRRVRTANYSLAGPIWESIAPTARDLVRALMTVDQHRRPTAADACEDVWLGGRGRPASGTADTGSPQVTRVAAVNPGGAQTPSCFCSCLPVAVALGIAPPAPAVKTEITPWRQKTLNRFT